MAPIGVSWRTSAPHKHRIDQVRRIDRSLTNKIPERWMLSRRLGRCSGNMDHLPLNYGLFFESTEHGTHGIPCLHHDGWIRHRTYDINALVVIVY